VCAELFALFFGAPVDEVAGVEGDAEEIGRNEAELGGAHADDTDDGAIDGSNDPALPELFADEHGGEHGEDAGEIVEPDDVEHIQHVVMTREQRVPSGMRMGNREAIRGGASAQGSILMEAASPCSGAI
jgi:hypothetical protein